MPPDEAISPAGKSRASLQARLFCTGRSPAFAPDEAFPLPEKAGLSLPAHRFCTVEDEPGLLPPLAIAVPCRKKPGFFAAHLFCTTKKPGFGKARLLPGHAGDKPGFFAELIFFVRGSPRLLPPDGALHSAGGKSRASLPLIFWHRGEKPGFWPRDSERALPEKAGLLCPLIFLVLHGKKPGFCPRMTRAFPAEKAGLLCRSSASLSCTRPRRRSPAFGPGWRAFPCRKKPGFFAAHLSCPARGRSPAFAPG